MLKSSFTPIFSTFPAKLRAKIPRDRAGIATFSQSPPTVRRNAPPRDALLEKFRAPPASAYVHLPFCRKRCHYCDFTIVALGVSLTPSDHDDPRMTDYIGLLCREIAATGDSDSETSRNLDTVFFGGGTPSLVPPRLVAAVLEALSSKFGLSSDAEVSMEMDPGTFDAAKMGGFLELGVNRVSLGIQAFQDELLKSCGRAHGVDEVHESVNIVKACGVENWSVDLISSLPRQTPEMWKESLKLTIDAGPTHVSVYDLQIEQGTKFGSLYTPGEFPLPSDSQSADFYRTASRMLTGAGYEHYEISSYGKSGFECNHNQVYWKNKPFYGFGLGSASYLGGLRFSRPKKMRGYADFVQKLENRTVNCESNEHIDSRDIATDVIMLSLRTSSGLDLRAFREEFGHSLAVSLCKAYRDFVGSGHVVCLNERRAALSAEEFDNLLRNENENGIAYLRLSDPDGFLLSNEIISHAFRVIAP